MEENLKGDKVGQNLLLSHQPKASELHGCSEELTSAKGEDTACLGGDLRG